LAGAGVTTAFARGFARRGDIARVFNRSVLVRVLRALSK